MTPVVRVAVVLALASLVPILRAADPVNDVAKLAGTAPVRVIFDTDMDSDCDDVGALGILHALADRGEAEILAVVVSGLEPFAGPCVDAINTYYGRPDLPVGTAREPGARLQSRYNKVIAERCPHDLESSSAAPDAVELYRQILSRQPDGSVTIVTVGFMTNIAKLLDVPARGSEPSGLDLVRKKVKLWVCMGGNFVGKPAKDTLKLQNHNFVKDADAAYQAITRWPLPLVFVGREIGSIPSGLKAGARLSELPADHPVRIGYEAYSRGVAKDRHVADLTTVLYAVRGLRDYWDAESKGSMILNPDMTFLWNEAGVQPQAYLLKRNGPDGKPNDQHIEQVINELLLQAPVRGRSTNVPPAR